MYFLVLRKLFTKNMILSVFVARIIKTIKIFRKSFKSTLEWSHLTFKGHVASYIFLACFLIFLQNQVIFPLHFFGAFVVGFIKQNSHDRKTEPKNFKKTINKPKGTRIRRAARKEGKDDSLLQAVFPSIDKIERYGKEGVTVAVYIRVSTPKQAKEGKSLKAQEMELRTVAKKIGASRAIFLIDAGKSGRDFSSRKLGVILALAAAGKIDKLVVSEIDRVGRRSLKLLGFLLQLRSYGVLIVTPTGELDLEKLADLVATTVKAFGAEEQNELRGYYALRSKVQSFLNRIWNLPVPLGYKKKKQWIEKNFGWDCVIKDVFTLFLRYKNYGVVADIVNRLHSSVLKKPLTRQQIRQILGNPVYIGKPRYFGEVVNRKFGEVAVNDPNLAYIDEESFQKAAKIISILSKRYKRREDELEELLANCGLDILDYLPNVALLCPDCQNKMVRNGQVYICKNCGRQLRAIKKKAIERIREWVLKRDKAIETIMRIYKRYRKKKKKWQDEDLEHTLEGIQEGNDSYS
ncbi:MAG: recombinase family protein [Candidatus Bathyarchaeia archaeon]